MAALNLLLRILPVLTLAGVLGLTACSKPADQTVRFGLAKMPATLDSRYATDAASARIQRLIYDRLVDFDDTMQVVPALAQWQRMGPTHYRFQLKELKNFHDGSRLTSADVRATYAAIIDPANASPHRGSLKIIQRMETPDERTIDFHLERADPLFPAYLVIGIMPEEKIIPGEKLGREAVGSGSFRFDQWPEGGRLTLERLRDGQKVEFLHVGNPTVRVLKLMRGEIDLVQNDLQPELVSYLGAEEEVEVTRQRGSNFAYLGFNLEDGVSGKLDIRRAIAHALDREAIIKHIFGGAARQASSILVPEHWAGHDGLPDLAYDPDKARELLAGLGYTTDHPLALSYKTSSDPFRIRVATVIQHQLAQVGIRMDIRSYDWGTFYGDIKAGRFQLYSLAWVGIKSPDIFRYVFHSDMIKEGANRGRFRDPVVDRLIEAAEREQSLSGQATLYRKLQERLALALPYVPLWYEDHVAVSRRELQGYTLSIDGNYDGLNQVILRRESP